MADDCQTVIVVQETENVVVTREPAAQVVITAQPVSVQVAPSVIPVVNVTPVAPQVIEVEVPGLRGPQGPAGPPGATVPFIKTAGMTLSGHRAVSPNSAGALVYASNLDLAPHRAVWLSLNAGIMGDDIVVLADGEVDESSWSWTPALPIFLGNNGLLTQAVPVFPAFQRRLAIAETSTKIYFDPSDSIVLI